MRESPTIEVGATRAWRAALAFSILLAAAPAPRAEESGLLPVAPAGIEGNRARTAVLAFVDYEDNVVTGLSPTELRLSAARAISTALHADGREVLTYPEIEPALRASGVRTSFDLPKEVLVTLGVDHDVTEVLIATLVIYPDRILLLGRALSPRSGILRWADVVESPFDLRGREAEARDALSEWNGVLETAGQALVSSRGAVASGNAETGRPAGGADEDDPAGIEAGGPAGRALVVLPVRAFGLSGSAREIATHALLSALLESDRWQIPDPGLVGNSLRSEGEDPSRLSATGRGKLAAWFTPAGALMPELLSYADSGPQLPRVAVEEDGPVASPTSTGRAPVHFQTLELDCRSGLLRSAHSVYLEPDEASGWFGFAKESPLSARFQRGATELVRRLLAGGSVGHTAAEAAETGESS